MQFAEVACCIFCWHYLTYASIGENSVDQQSESTLFVIKLQKHFKRRKKQTYFIIIGALKHSIIDRQRKPL